MIEVNRIIKKLDPVSVIGSQTVFVTRVIRFEPSNNDPGAVSWVNEKNIEKLYQLECGVVLAPTNLDLNRLSSRCTILTFENPRAAFRNLLQHFFMLPPRSPVISKTAVIGMNVTLGKNVSIGNFTVVEDNVVIGDNTIIGHNNSILAGTIIENDVRIGSNNTIGGVGFGYERDELGHYQLMPHIGHVLIKRFAEIGNNTCIDRAVIGSTLIGENVKVDNLVHIAHGVTVGSNSLVIAHAMIGGSTVIGNNVWIAPNAAVKNGLHVADDSIIGLAAVVVKSVERGVTVIGNPAKPLNKR